MSHDTSKSSETTNSASEILSNLRHEIEETECAIRELRDEAVDARGDIRRAISNIHSALIIINSRNRRLVELGVKISAQEAHLRILESQSIQLELTDAFAPYKEIRS